MKALHAALATFFRLLPVRTSEYKLQGRNGGPEQSVPASFAAIVLNGLFFPTAARILSTGLVLTWFVSDLTPSAFWVGLLVPIQQGLALVPQPIFAQWLATKPRSSPYYTAQSFLRTVVWSGLGLTAWSLGNEHASALLALFFLVFAVDATCGGFGNIAFNDALASVIPPGLRGHVRGWRGIFGSIAAGGDFSLATDKSGSAFSWGNNAQGELGNEAGAQAAEGAIDKLGLNPDAQASP